MVPFLKDMMSQGFNVSDLRGLILFDGDGIVRDESEVVRYGDDENGLIRGKVVVFSKVYCLVVVNTGSLGHRYEILRLMGSLFEGRFLVMLEKSMRGCREERYRVLLSMSKDMSYEEVKERIWEKEVFQNVFYPDVYESYGDFFDRMFGSTTSYIVSEVV